MGAWLEKANERFSQSRILFRACPFFWTVFADLWLVLLSTGAWRLAAERATKHQAAETDAAETRPSETDAVETDEVETDTAETNTGADAKADAKKTGPRRTPFHHIPKGR